MANAAARLHDLLEAVQEQGGAVATAWGQVLGAEHGTADFVRRYSEVWGLLADTLKIVDALPPTSQRRYHAYAKDWLALVASPRSDWLTNAVASDDNALHLLGSLGDVADSRLRGSLLVPTGDADLAQLRQQCSEWITRLEGSDELSEPVREGLRAQLLHVIWLIDMAGTFGTSRPLQEASAAESLLRAQESRFAGDRLTGWKQATATFTITIMAATGFANTVVQPALEAVTAVVQDVGELGKAVGDLTDAEPDGDIVDGEVVDSELTDGR